MLLFFSVVCFQSQMLLHPLLFFPRAFYLTKPGPRSWPKGSVLLKFLFTCSVVLSLFYISGSFLLLCLFWYLYAWNFLIPLVFYTPAVMETGLCWEQHGQRLLGTTGAGPAWPRSSVPAALGTETSCQLPSQSPWGCFAVTNRITSNWEFAFLLFGIVLAAPHLQHCVQR